jgi:hypothetical protein
MCSGVFQVSEEDQDKVAHLKLLEPLSPVVLLPNNGGLLGMELGVSYQLPDNLLLHPSALLFQIWDLEV